ncbi:MAG: serine protease, partial [Firmicutes bacterium]|nr:serine protease [Bacillota bacterium]
IDKILDEISRDAVMYLINALAFDAEWEEPYTDIQVREDIFTTTDGREQKVDFMYGSEYQYLQDENAQGFIKYYNNRDY